MKLCLLCVKQSICDPVFIDCALKVQPRDPNCIRKCRVLKFTKSACANFKDLYKHTDMQISLHFRTKTRSVWPSSWHSKQCDTSSKINQRHFRHASLRILCWKLSVPAWLKSRDVVMLPRCKVLFKTRGYLLVWAPSFPILSCLVLSRLVLSILFLILNAVTIIYNLQDANNYLTVYIYIYILYIFDMDGVQSNYNECCIE